MNDLEYLVMDLQLFADDEANDTAIDEIADDSNSAEIEGEETQEHEKREDRVPLNKFLEEKKRRRELERKLKEFEERNMSYEQQQEIEDIRKLARDKGYDDDFAELLGEFGNKIMKSMPKVDRVEAEILEDIQDYADENPEVLKYKKEIVEKVKKYRKADPDFGIEDALNLIKPSKIRYSELKTDIEQKQAMARRNVENKKVASASASSPKESYPLDEADRKALEGLQKMQPDKNWTAEKYYKSRYSK